MSHQNLVEQFRNARNPCLLVGAGLSLSAPTSIPLFKGLRDAYLSAIDPDHSRLAQASGDDLGRTLDAIDSSPIEMFFSAIYTTLGDRAMAPLRWMDGRPRNSGHMAILALATEIDISTVLTTNFDKVLERTLPFFRSVDSMKNGSRRIAGSAGDEVCYIRNDHKTIFHLHGAIGSDQFDITMANTSMPFDHYDHASIAPRLKDATLLVLGYGGGDRLDILPLLRRCDPREVIWLIHEEGGIGTECQPPDEWIPGVAASGSALKGDTLDLISSFVDGHIEDPDEELPGDGFQETVMASLADVSEDEKVYLLALLATNAGCGAASIRLLEDHVTPTPNHIEQRFVWERARAISLSRLGDSASRQSAIDILLKLTESPGLAIAIEQQSRSSIRREYGLVLESIAVISLEEGCPPDAAEYLDSARRFLRSPDDILRLEMLDVAIKRNLDLEDSIGAELAKEVESSWKLLASMESDTADRTRARVLFESAAKTAHRNQNPFASIRLYERAIVADPNDASLYVDLSSLQRNIGSPAVLETLEAGLSIDSRCYELLCNKGLVLTELGNHSEAVEVLLQAVAESKGQDPLALNNLGNAYYNLGDIDIAIETYSRAIAIDPVFDEAIANLDKAHRRRSAENT